ncbi:SDR family NAD(P)-dependent oxidoreductase [Paraglaciecola psychrophila]|uniref:Short-chain dehydrogenase/reductase SDR n=1 Tax=Paraglaciecola psychrophila 170 TaxID=1129794 RepID=K6ZT20_9ALTE|nr:SDR family NAD(P)-dependent oxidoreductase [Paraglaciecola psychrophila]AGH43044.1 short-chain dehydrogenase/reductase SDR [Paraglaciecola psychrophila 170]GAC39071.1 3-oxoacyl-[acyl-carrier-protein] reductase [Paraglaciecola psychrophila 170]
MSNEFAGKTAIISGGAGGIGLALAEEFGQLGMQIVIADIDQKELAIAEQKLRDANIQVLSCPLDVTNYQQWEDTVAAAEAKFGNIHMLVNNAGVGGIPGSVDKTKIETWKWVLDVNVMGVVNGTQATAPSMKRHGQGGWIINVASMAGMNGVPFSGAYAASKAAVVSMSESWAVELKKHNIAVSALCPAFVQTRIHESLRNLQPEYKGVKDQAATLAKSGSAVNKAKALVESGIPTSVLAKRVVEALQSGQTYIFTHPNFRSTVAYRSSLLDAAFADAENSPIVRHLKDDEIVML